MTAILFLANVTVLVIGLAVGFARGRLYTVLFGALLILQVSSLLLIGQDQRLYGASVVQLGQALVLAGNVVLVSLVLLAERLDLPAAQTSNRQSMRLEAALVPRYLLMVVGLLFIAYAIRFRSGIGAGLATWQQARAESGSIDAIGNVCGFFAVPSPAVLWWARRRVAALAITPFVLWYVQLAGSRALALTLPAFVIIAMIRTTESFGRKLIKVSVLGLLAMTFFAGFRMVRNVPITEVPMRLSEALTAPGNDISGGESRMMGSLYYLLSADRNEYPFGDGVTAQRLATIYVPRTGDAVPKPGDVTYEIWNNYLDDGYLDRDPYYDVIRGLGDAETPGSDHATIWGDAFANYRYLGVLLYGLVIGGAVLFVDLASMRLSAIARVLVLPVAAVTYQFAARGNVVIAVGYLAYGLPIVGVLLLVMRVPIFDARRRRPVRRALSTDLAVR